MMLRGQALNQIYGVGPTKQEVRALAERGQALNRMYHLGSYATARGKLHPRTQRRGCSRGHDRRDPRRVRGDGRTPQAPHHDSRLTAPSPCALR